MKRSGESHEKNIICILGKFINIDSDGNEKGNGIEFENLVNCLLVSMYRKKSVSYKKVLLVDDILHDGGATIEACTKSLHAAGNPRMFIIQV